MMLILIFFNSKTTEIFIIYSIKGIPFTLIKGLVFFVMFASREPNLQLILQPDLF